MRSFPVWMALMVVTIALSTWVGRLIYPGGHETEAALAMGGILLVGTVALFGLRGASWLSQLKVGIAVGAGVLIPVLGQLAYSHGLVDTRGAVMGVAMVLAALATVLLRGSVPLLRILVLALGLLTFGLTLLGMLPLPEFVGSIVASMSGVAFAVLQVAARRKQPRHPKA